MFRATHVAFVHPQHELFTLITLSLWASAWGCDTSHGRINSGAEHGAQRLGFSPAEKLEESPRKVPTDLVGLESKSAGGRRSSYWATLALFQGE